MYNVCIMILKPTLNWPVDCVWNFKSLQLRVVPSIAIKFGQLLVLQILNVSRIVKVFFFSPLFLVLEASDILVSTVISSLPLLSYTCTYNNISLLTTVFILNVVLEFEFSSFHCNSISLFPLHTVTIVLLRFPFVIGPTVQVLLSQTPTCQLTTTC